MAINPDNITTIRVDQLPEDTLNLTNDFAHSNGTDLKRATIQSLVDLVSAAIGSSSGVGYLALSVTDGQQLPDVPTEPSFFLAGAGTYLNINGFPDVICTENLNAIMSLTDHWELAVEIPINPLSGTVESVTGSAVDNTDPLNPVINTTGGGGAVDSVNGQTGFVSIDLSSVLTEGNVAVDSAIFLSNTANDFETSFNEFGDGQVILKSVVNDTLTQVGAGQIYLGNFDGSDNAIINKDGIYINPNNYAFPSGASSPLATLDDIPTSTGIPHATASGTDTYTATISGITSYADGDAYLIRFTNGNTSNCTLNINSIGAVNLYRNNDGVLLGGDIVAGGEMLCVYNSAISGFSVIGTSPNSLYAYVTNDDSVTLTKGMPVYAFSGTGDRMTVKRANNTGDSTSAQTVGLVLSASIAAGQKGIIMMQGLLDGLSILPTSTFADGDAVYLGATDGSITNVKPSAPNHLVYLGVVTTASNGSSGRMYVRVQNGYELQELHNVALTSPPNNNDVLTYETATSLWKNKSIGTILGYTPYKFVYTTQATYLGAVIGLAETSVAQTTILANTFDANDFMKMFFKVSKAVTTGTVSMRIRVNTTNTLVGATQIALLTVGTANTYALMNRNINLAGGNAYAYNVASSVAGDINNTNTAGTSFTLNTTNDLYVFFTIQLGNVADSATFQLANISN